MIDDKITVCQLNLMKHAIGLDNKKPKRGKYTAYRNYYCSHGKNCDWETLIECGLAKSRNGDHEMHPSYTMFYWVTQDGLRLLESVFGCKIVEE